MKFSKKTKDTILSQLKSVSPITKNIEKKIYQFNNIIRKNSINLTMDVGIQEIKNRTLDYVSSMRVEKNSVFQGYKHSSSVKKTTLYSTIAALLIKHLYGIKDKDTIIELEYLKKFQRNDGLFYDKNIDCKVAYTSSSWGWTHLTLHALMTLALYNENDIIEFQMIKKFFIKNNFKEYLDTRNWEDKVLATSNEIQNIGVMLQYARDYQNISEAGKALEFLLDFIDKKQNKDTGLFGSSFKNSIEISYGIQAAYHFWLLHFYNKRPINYIKNVIDYLLDSQNILGGYGYKLNSSACEDIDSIDPLIRFTTMNEYRNVDIQNSLRLALSFILSNYNNDGGFVFRRHEPLMIVHKNMFSGINESNMFYTWFRTLGMAYCLKGLIDVPENFNYNWNFTKAPGHQFL